jgi:MtN3 and saliva related transmembrane protein
MTDVHILVLGYVSGALTTSAGIPQIIKVFRSSSTKDLSYVSLSMSALGLCMWTIYGVLLKDQPMIIFDTLSLVTCTTLLSMKVYMENFKKEGMHVSKYCELSTQDGDQV